MMKKSENTRPEGIPFSAMIYGPSKVGKSSLMLTAPGKLLFGDVEGQVRFLGGRRKDWDMVGPPPEDDGTWDWVRVRINTYDGMRRMFEWLNTGEHPFDSVCIDSISELQQKYIDQEAPGGRQMETQNWGTVLRGMAALVRSFRDLLEHPVKPLLFVGITAMETDKAGKARPFVQGQLANMAPYFLDIVGHYVTQTDLTTGISSRVLQISPKPFYEAGSRLPSAQTDIVNPSLMDIFNSTHTHKENSDG